jgi:IS1 family transposase
MDEETKLVPVYTVGKRTEETTWYFINELAERISSRIQLTTDGFVFYNRHVEDAFGAEVDFAQLIKLYGQYGHRRRN